MQATPLLFSSPITDIPSEFENHIFPAFRASLDVPTSFPNGEVKVLSESLLTF